jgi:hypothetical protein
MARKFKGTSFKQGSMISISGVSDLLKKIEKAQGRVDEAVMKATDASLEVIGKEAQRLMRPLSPGKSGTGDTYRSFEQRSAKMNGNFVQASVGYDVDKGGLPAIFLDVGWTGTPKREPKKGHFWRYYAVENTRSQVNEAQKKALKEIWEGLK